MGRSQGCALPTLVLPTEQLPLKSPALHMSPPAFTEVTVGQLVEAVGSESSRPASVCHSPADCLRDPEKVP